MVECVKCGYVNHKGVKACKECTWPLHIDAWKTASQKITRVTIDTCCVNAKQKNTDLNTLERWDSEDKISLQRSSAFLSELKGPFDRLTKGNSITAHPNLFTLGISCLDGPDVLAGPDVGGSAQDVLFPTAQNLTKNQENDVEHIRLHVMTGADVFVTLNTNDFIKHKKQELLAACGIWIFTPNQIVGFLNDLYGWK